MMSVDSNPVLNRMNHLISLWENEQDRKLIFLNCYQMMTRNVLLAIETGEFEDGEWVGRLMEIFAGYYFNALESFEDQHPATPLVWKIAFTAVENPHINSLQNLVLGVNAHINYDLVLALSDLLRDEWPILTKDQRELRYRDHCRVNHVIHQTINAVQDKVIGRYDPEFHVMDKLLGPLDEWMTTLLITEWREEVWKHATILVEATQPGPRDALLNQVEKISLDRAKDILGSISLTSLLDFI
jgi:hypothetical protein